ncbi:hypothetical protein QQS21_001478 [Conoideocrella luteorostrata]|uniref:Uncharacterized protein n=1 Tax=Conoideocrella luteorostrata TaxID=1105319 RepID=A0AAJ0G1V9_9HYPO|nr:hypothetical protein QQS21_001478 [Conoideocrella luteorostrata]
MITISDCRTDIQQSNPSLNKTEAQGICDGDSGAWVIDTLRCELYGQLVASDWFGSGYVIPMQLIFDDIKRQFKAEHVELPTTVDVYLAKQALADRMNESHPDRKFGLDEDSEDDLPLLF